ncbi:glutenin, low molecular weight subunit-like [Gastrolobium bilobum]|uniref:glutenin, low molecular weight subunit-like n=1 Tax=Gastrolobium bilobum TaxID=150636 RepID=UPI002AB08A96|nr:glutenin, low molecular weight subunit-like [Gastrolobium bilobum]
MVVTTRRAEQTRAVTPDGHVQTIHSNSPPSMHSAPAERPPGEMLQPVLQSVGPQMQAVEPRIAQLNYHAPMREMQGENLIQDQPPPPGVRFGMPLHTFAPPVIPVPRAHHPLPAQSLPVAMHNDYRAPMVTPFPMGPYAPFPQLYPTGFPFQGYAAQPQNPAVPLHQVSYQNQGQQPYAAQQPFNQAPALSYSVEAPQPQTDRPPETTTYESRQLIRQGATNP